MTITAKPYNPKDWFWIVGGDETQVYSSRSKAYVLVAGETFTQFIGTGGVATRIRNEVELQDVLLKQAPSAALARQFTIGEVREALEFIDKATVDAAFGAANSSAAPMQSAVILAEIASDLGFLLGALASD